MRHEIGFDRNGGIDGPSSARGADADATHRFDAAADRQIMLPRHHLRGGEVDRVEARGAESVDLNARDMVAIIRRERRRAGDVAARLADWIDAAQDHIIDEFGIEAAAILDRPQNRCGEGKARDLMQGAVRLAATARRAHMIINEGFGHGFLPVSLIHLERLPIGLSGKAV